MNIYFWLEFPLRKSPKFINLYGVSPILGALSFASIGVMQDGIGDRSSILIYGVLSIISFLALIKCFELLYCEFFVTEWSFVFFVEDPNVFTVYILVGSVCSN